MIISIKSDYKDMSWVLRKNPVSLPKGAQIRQGSSIGFYPNPQQYVVYFQDTFDEVSYPESGDQSFNYLDPHGIVSPLAGLNILSEYFRGCSDPNPENPETEPHNHVVEIIALNAQRDRTIETMNSYFPDFRVIESSYSYDKYRRITIEHRGYLRDLIAYLHLFLLVVALDNRTFIGKSTDLFDKYIDFIVKLDAPYFIRYLFKVMLIRSRKDFEKIKDDLEQSDRWNIRLKFGDTHVSRMDWTKPLITSDEVVDIGCGYDARYAKMLSRSVSKYHAVDIDPEALESAKRRLKGRENVYFYEDASEVNPDGKVDIIISEVIEHLDNMDQAVGLVQRTVDHFDFNKIIITTPNRDFNDHYQLEDEFRHDDHGFEMGEDDFNKFVSMMYYYVDNVDVYKIGDVVDGITPTFGLILYNKREI